MERQMEHKTILRFDTTPEVDAAIAGLKERLGLETNAEVFRNALAIMAWMTKQTEEGSVIISVKEGQDTAKELISPALENARPPHQKRLRALGIRF